MNPRQRRPRINRHYKIDHDLPEAEREAYAALLRDPRTTIDAAHAWLVAHGHADVSRSAVARHRRHYLEAIDRRQQTADAARQYAALARSGELPLDALVTGVAFQSEALLFDALVDSPLRGKKLSLKQLAELGKLVDRMVTTRIQMVELERLRGAAKGRGDDRSSDSAPAPSRPTPEQEREEAVRRVCEILDDPCPPRRPAGPTAPGAVDDASRN